MLSEMFVLKFEPTIVTVVPTGPDVELKDVIVGGIVTVKDVPEFAVNPLTVT